VIQKPRFEVNPYSIPAGVCLAITACGGALLLAMTSFYFMP
jgi:hypothetical protein